MRNVRLTRWCLGHIGGQDNVGSDYLHPEPRTPELLLFHHGLSCLRESSRCWLEIRVAMVVGVPSRKNADAPPKAIRIGQVMEKSTLSGGTWFFVFTFLARCGRPGCLSLPIWVNIQVNRPCVKEAASDSDHHSRQGNHSEFRGYTGDVLICRELDVEQRALPLSPERILLQWIMPFWLKPFQMTS